MALLRDRAEAGQQLAGYLLDFAGRPDTIVLALPRGGVPVAYEIARALHVSLDVFVVRKLGVPGHEELAMGAIASGGAYIVDAFTVENARVDRAALQRTLQREAAELTRRTLAYREDRPEPDLFGKSIIVVDDGLATGASMYVAVRALRTRDPASIVVAVPVAPVETVEWLRGVTDRIVCPHQYERFGAVGLHYSNFNEVSDDEVCALLAQARIALIS